MQGMKEMTFPKTKLVAAIAKPMGCGETRSTGAVRQHALMVPTPIESLKNRRLITPALCQRARR
jgi:hypothetical protein